MSFEKFISVADAQDNCQRALINIFHTYYYLIDLMNDALKKHDVTRQQYHVLNILREQQPMAASVNLIRARMLDKMSDVSRIVERLRLKGLVVRQGALKDKRAVDIHITPKGLAFLSTLDPDITRLSELLGHLTKEETVALNNMLDKIRAKERGRGLSDLSGNHQAHRAFSGNP